MPAALNERGAMMSPALAAWDVAELLRSVSRMLLRKSWFRILAVTIAVLVTSMVLYIAPPANLRQEALKALQAATLLFAICAAISLVLFSNYVKGLREAYLKRLLDVRTALEKFYDEHKSSSDTDIQSLLDTYIIPLLKLNTNQWMIFDPVKEILPNVMKPAAALHKKDATFLPRYLLRIEDETNELGLLFIRRIGTYVHLKAVTGAFVLVAIGVGALGFSYLLPSGYVGDFIVANIATAIVSFTVIELLVLVTHLRQEGREEEPQYSDEDETVRGNR